jgi:hypothetical protein
MADAVRLPDSPRQRAAWLREMGWQHPERITIPENIPDNAFETDKIIQQYMPVYEAIARELGPAARVCEAGVWQGGSLATWKVLFPDGLIAGVDIDPRCHWPDGTVRIVCAQEDEALPGLLAEHSPDWDLIIDDASHEGWRSRLTLRHLWPVVRPGGYYVVEDWFYGWHEGQAGKYNMVDFAKELLDLLHGSPGQEVEEIRYRYGMAILKKAPSGWNEPVSMVTLENLSDSLAIR